VLPLAVVVTHVLARKQNPCRSKTPDLDLLAAAIGVSLLWLFAGGSVEMMVINLFNLTFAGVAVIFASLATGGPSVDPRWRYALLPFTALVVFVCALVAAANAAQSQWYDPTWPPILIGVGLCLATALARPQWFNTWRAPKAFGVAMVVPVVLFVADGVFA
jgi:hypothetical protein